MSSLPDLLNSNLSSFVPTPSDTTAALHAAGNLPSTNTQTLPTVPLSNAFNPLSFLDDVVKGIINGVTNVANTIGQTVETIGQNIQHGIINAENDLTRWLHQFEKPLTFDIGPSNDPNLTHVYLLNNNSNPQNVVGVQINLTVDNVSQQALKGLNFWALQVDWPNNTWAHGGPQTHIANPSQPWGNQVNWGGLVNHGGGSDDYAQVNPAKDIYLLQAGPNRLAPYDWEVGKTYTLSVERGNLVTLPPGTYNYGGDGQPVKVDDARQMWEWTFTMKPADGSGSAYTSTMYNSSPYIYDTLFWSESGYGNLGAAKNSIWTDPQYTTADGRLHYYNSYYRF